MQQHSWSSGFVAYVFTHKNRKPLPTVVWEGIGSCVTTWSNRRRRRRYWWQRWGRWGGRRLIAFSCSHARLFVPVDYVIAAVWRDARRVHVRDTGAPRPARIAAGVRRWRRRRHRLRRDIWRDLCRASQLRWRYCLDHAQPNFSVLAKDLADVFAQAAADVAQEGVYSHVDVLLAHHDLARGTVQAQKDGQHPAVEDNGHIEIGAVARDCVVQQVPGCAAHASGEGPKQGYIERGIPVVRHMAGASWWERLHTSTSCSEYREIRRRP